MDISVYIPHGRKNAISRQALKDLTGCSDRENRAMIERARMNGTPILSSSACSGYWISDDPSEIDAFRREQAHRAKKLMRMVSALDNKKAELEGYEVIPVKAHLRRIRRADKNQITLWG